MSRFLTILFGENEHGFWNEPTYHSTQRAATKWGMSMWNVGEVLGYVVVKIDHETWQVVDEESRIPDYSVSWNGFGFVKVKRAPKLVMVEVNEDDDFMAQCELANAYADSLV